MPEEAPAVEETTQETPESGPAEAPAPDSQESIGDYEKRYNDLRPQYDRTQSELNEIKQRFSQYEQFIQILSNPETQAEALRQFGIELEDGEEDEYSDPDEPLTRAEFEQFLHSRQEAEAAFQAQEEALDADAQFADEAIAELEKEHGKFSEQELDALLPLAHVLRDEAGNLGIKQAHSLLGNVFETRQKRYLESKKAPKVPIGEAGEAKIDIADDEARTQALAAMLEAGQAE